MLIFDIVHFVIHMILLYMIFIHDHILIILGSVAVFEITRHLMFKTKYFDIDTINTENPPK